MIINHWSRTTLISCPPLSILWCDDTGCSSCYNAMYSERYKNMIYVKFAESGSTTCPMHSHISSVHTHIPPPTSPPLINITETFYILMTTIASQTESCGHYIVVLVRVSVTTGNSLLLLFTLSSVRVRLWPCQSLVRSCLGEGV